MSVQKTVYNSKAPPPVAKAPPTNYRPSLPTSKAPPTNYRPSLPTSKAPPPVAKAPPTNYRPPLPTSKAPPPKNNVAQALATLEKAKTKSTEIKVGFAFLALLIIIGVIGGVVFGVPEVRKNLYKSSNAGGNAADSCGKLFKSSNS